MFSGSSGNKFWHKAGFTYTHSPATHYIIEHHQNDIHANIINICQLCTTSSMLGDQACRFAIVWKIWCFSKLKHYILWAAINTDPWSAVVTQFTFVGGWDFWPSKLVLQVSPNLPSADHLLQVIDRGWLMRLPIPYCNHYHQVCEILSWLQP